jgi:hypothetical protein
MAAPTREDVLALADLALAQETTLNALRAQLELDIVVFDEGLKGRIHDELKKLGEVPPRVRAFKLVVQHWLSKGTAGSTRLSEAKDADLGALLLRFRPLFRDPAPGKPWRFTLAIGQGAGKHEREAIADLANAGGSQEVLVRRPRQGLGKKAQDVEKRFFPERAEERERKGKSKGKGRGGKGKGRGGANGGPTLPQDGDALMGTPAVDAAAAAGVRGTYAGRDADLPPTTRRSPPR